MGMLDILSYAHEALSVFKDEEASVMLASMRFYSNTMQVNINNSQLRMKDRIDVKLKLKSQGIKKYELVGIWYRSSEGNLCAALNVHLDNFQGWIRFSNMNASSITILEGDLTQFGDNVELLVYRQCAPIFK
eukprot:TRINITY_DN4489_c0_g1_i1.p1 TRINITY_DN4489_c0_g1~~TRINITY_DN4489_c0_g1_i1.p1  ORF type:complete len:132 (+),score=17.15 TRINITY_DN4489_c0_g1_i1:212-607(+)